MRVNHVVKRKPSWPKRMAGFARDRWVRRIDVCRQIARYRRVKNAV